jgi:hypothetical protein
MKTKNKLQESEPEQFIVSYTRSERLRCMSFTDGLGIKILTNIMRLLNAINNHGIKNMDRDKMWLYDVDAERIFPIGPIPVHGEFGGLGARTFCLASGLISGCDLNRFQGPILGTSKVWDVDELPPGLNKYFQSVPSDFVELKF